MNKKITLIPGDGIGPDVVSEAVNVLKRTAQLFGHAFDFQEASAGGCAYDRFGTPLPEETLQACDSCDAVLLGAVGGPKWDNVEQKLRPESGLLGLRSHMNLFCNLRPALLFPQLREACPLRPDLVEGGLDIMVVRELTGGVYFGSHVTLPDGKAACDEMRYSSAEIDRILRMGFETAMKRSRRLTSVDKANVLATSRLWRASAERMAEEYPEVRLNHLYVDNAAMQLVRQPRQFDVIVTENMFGDILSDEAAMITGSIGMLPSASLRADHFGMYEPIHGSAPDIAGQDKANPIATILSAGMMLRYTFEMPAEACAIECAVSEVLDQGWRTDDIMSDGMRRVGTHQMGDLITKTLKCV